MAGHNRFAGRAVVPGLIAAAIVLSALAEGYWSGRWAEGTGELPPGFLDALRSLPLETASWQGRKSEPIDPRVLEISGASVIVSAAYRNRATADGATVFLVGGWSRDVSVHTPDACYPGAGFTMEGRPYPFLVEYVPSTVGSGSRRADGAAGREVQTAEFTTAVFTKAEPTGTVRLRVFWAWQDGSGWKSPAVPRWTYGGRRPLVKAYFVAESPPATPAHHSPAVALARELLPRLDALLIPILQRDGATKP
ncbi:MAG: exosortase-associated EpsI family protein [Thermogutta sp.]|nr:exosortase-associated EpsI family protein [Thermogutta sp.]